MKPLVKVLIASCLMGLVTIGFAQNEGKKKGGGNDPTTKLADKVKEAELGDELNAKVVKIIDENAAKLKEAQAKVDSVLTDDQRPPRRPRRKPPRTPAAKKKAAAEVAAAVKLTDEQKKKMDEANAALTRPRRDEQGDQRPATPNSRRVVARRAKRRRTTRIARAGSMPV